MIALLRRKIKQITIFILICVVLLNAANLFWSKPANNPMPKNVEQSRHTRNGESLPKHYDDNDVLGKGLRDAKYYREADLPKVLPETKQLVENNGVPMGNAYNEESEKDVNEPKEPGEDKYEKYGIAKESNSQDQQELQQQQNEKQVMYTETNDDDDIPNLKDDMMVDKEEAQQQQQQQQPDEGDEPDKVEANEQGEQLNEGEQKLEEGEEKSPKDDEQELKEREEESPKDDEQELEEEKEKKPEDGKQELEEDNLVLNRHAFIAKKIQIKKKILSPQKAKMTSIVKDKEQFNVSIVLPPRTKKKKSCKERQNVYMLKVHKSGSTSLQNIMWRFGLSRGLRMMIFPKAYPYPLENYHETFPKPTDLNFKGVFNQMTEHSIFHKPAIEATMPKDTVNIAILREPLAQLRSAAGYYDVVHGLVGMPQSTARNVVLKKFLENPAKYEPAVVPKDQYKVRNHVVNMLGYKDWANVDNPPIFDKFLHLRDSEFSMVLILERIEESLVLLRRALCWDMKDVLSLQLRNSEEEQDPVEDSIEDFEMEYRSYNPGDYAVYDYFVRALQMRIDEQKDDFSGEVQWLKQAQTKTKEFCQTICEKIKSSHDRLSAKNILESSISFKATQWDDAFVVTGSDCLLMMFNPYVYRNAIKVVNYPQLCDPDKGGDEMDKRWTIPDRYCKKDNFLHTIPWASIWDPKEYVHACV